MIRSCFKRRKDEVVVLTAFKKATFVKKTFLVLRKLNRWMIRGIATAKPAHRKVGYKNAYISVFGRDDKQVPKPAGYST
ncbi:hypothetical protein ACFFJX_27030 [Pseudarcicella hirudinis]|uniref:hypothetical protein n=1 Tax=Pseudarcicella hirudinis TaxID=1079859 RepID=UPI0035ED0FE9